MYTEEKRREEEGGEKDGKKSSLLSIVCFVIYLLDLSFFSSASAAGNDYAIPVRTVDTCPACFDTFSLFLLLHPPLPSFLLFTTLGVYSIYCYYTLAPGPFEQFIATTPGTEIPILESERRVEEERSGQPSRSLHLYPLHKPTHTHSSPLF